MAAKVLLVEDDRALREALSDTLLLGGHEFVAVDSAEAALPVLAREAFSLVISDVNMPGMDGHQLLGLIRTRYPHLPVLLMTAYGAVDRAVEAMRQGAADYLVKPFEARALLDLVARHALGQLPGSEEDGPVALEPASRQLLELAARVARSDSTVLISGESGTGKEVLANYIHQQSPRAGKPFIAINCAAIPDNMLEATLFGHEKGSFTGAIAAQPGKFELADGGTILLDEISEMPLACRPSCCAYCRSARWSGSVRASRSTWISACLPRPTAISRRKSRRGVSARTSTIACRSSRWPGGRCANALRTSCRWPSVCCASTAAR